MLEFKSWPKTPRLNREMIVTEKIDGTNAAVIVVPVDGLQNPGVGSEVNYGQDACGPYWTGVGDNLPGVIVETSAGLMVVAAQSRKRLIKPGKQSDNAGFAAWVRENAHGLAQALGDGYHYGEWWGKGIQHGYGLDDKRFSLFNVERYAHVSDPSIGLGLVPELYRGPFSTAMVNGLVNDLRVSGSKASPGHPAEGVIVFHTAAGMVFKVTCEKDEHWKSRV